jgi:hypothetical protein
MAWIRTFEENEARGILSWIYRVARWSRGIEANLEFARRYVDWPYIQHPTPYPRTPMTEDFQKRGLITDDRPENYDGTTAVVRTNHLTAEEIEFLRWRAERWMKLRHLPSVFIHNPIFPAAPWHEDFGPYVSRRELEDSVWPGK